jgi:hypothetical protein
MRPGESFRRRADHGQTAAKMIEFEPQSVADRRGSRRPFVVALLVLVALVVAVAKPWVTRGTGAGPVARDGVADHAASVTPSADPSSSVPLPRVITSGAQPQPSLGNSPTIAAIVRDLARRSGAWGVGTGGSGPRMVRDDPWFDWAPVEPASDAGAGGARLAIWPDSGLCTETPSLLGGPRLVAVTAPRGILPDWHLVGWWSNGSQIASLDGIVRQVSPAGNRGISYLERLDGGLWPDGRYEFRVVAGTNVTSLVVCFGTS